MTRWFEDGRLRFAVGIEDTFVPQESPGRRRLDEYELTQHYHLWHEDLGHAAATGADMLRWGVPCTCWSRPRARSAGTGSTEWSTGLTSSA